MLNLILIFGMLLNLAAGLFFIARFECVVWGERGMFLFKKTAPCLEWDHDELYP